MRLIQEYKDRSNGNTRYIVLQDDNSVASIHRRTYTALLRDGVIESNNGNELLIKYDKELTKLLRAGAERVKSKQSILDFAIFYMGDALKNNKYMTYDMFIKLFEESLDKMEAKVINCTNNVNNTNNKAMRYIIDEHIELMNTGNKIFRYDLINISLCNGESVYGQLLGISPAYISIRTKKEESLIRLADIKVRKHYNKNRLRMRYHKMVTVLKVNKLNNRIISYTCTDGNTTVDISKQELETYIKRKLATNATIQTYNGRTIIRVTDVLKANTNINTKKSEPDKNIITELFNKEFSYILQNNNIVISKYKGNCSVVNIPLGVRGILNDCFNNCNTVETITIPLYCDMIQPNAFNGAPNLKNIIAKETTKAYEYLKNNLSKDIRLDKYNQKVAEHNEIKQEAPIKENIEDKATVFFALCNKLYKKYNCKDINIQFKKRKYTNKCIRCFE